MNKTEREFLNDIKDAVSSWDCSFSHYHDNNYGDRYFCVDISVDDRDADWDEVWNALEEVTDDWGAGLDESMGEFSVALQIED